MDFYTLKNIIIEIPLYQIAILAGLCCFFAIWGKTKLCLIAVLGALLYWVFFLNEPKFGFSDESQILYTGLFILSSIIFVGCTAWAFFVE